MPIGRNELAYPKSSLPGTSHAKTWKVLYGTWRMPTAEPSRVGFDQMMLMQFGARSNRRFQLKTTPKLGAWLQYGRARIGQTEAGLLES
jgi:hypothetical protein